MEVACEGKPGERGGDYLLMKGENLEFLPHDLGVHEGFESAKFSILFRG